MAVLQHEDVSAIQEVVWKVEEQVGDVISGWSGLQMGHVTFES